MLFRSVACDPHRPLARRPTQNDGRRGLERELIVKALDQTSSNVTHAARLLKISRKGLQLKMKELGLRERDERSDS